MRIDDEDVVVEENEPRIGPGPIAGGYENGDDTGAISRASAARAPPVDAAIENPSASSARYVALSGALSRKNLFAPPPNFA